MREKIISFILGVILFPFTLVIGIFILCFLPIIYGFGGYLVIGRMSKENCFINSMLFGAGLILWLIIFLYIGGWASEITGEVGMIIMAVASLICTYIGARVAISEKTRPID